MLESVPEIKEVVSNAYDDQILTVNKHNGEVKEDRALQSVFTKLMSVNREVISKALSRFINRLSKENEVRTNYFQRSVILILFFVLKLAS